VVTYDANGGYGHPDHIRAHEVTMAATADVPDIARVYYAVTSRSATEKGTAALAELSELPFQLAEADELSVTDDELITTTIDISDHLPAKLSAMRAHATQVSVWQSAEGVAAYALSNGVAQPVVGAEYYVLARGAADGASTDLFGGLNSEAGGDRDWGKAR
jgi:N-acetyl-1-D-myo-inositol-2-amino-2-deoxy-alpha-D-glucopyranoside deacetylase